MAVHTSLTADLPKLRKLTEWLTLAGYSEKIEGEYSLSLTKDPISVTLFYGRYSDLADVFVWRQVTEGLETLGEIVGCHEVCEVRSQLIMAVVVVAFYSGLLDRAVHPCDLSVGPGMIGFGQSVLNAVCLTDHVKAHRP